MGGPVGNSHREREANLTLRKALQCKDKGTVYLHLYDPALSSTARAQMFIIIVALHFCLQGMVCFRYGGYTVSVALG